MRVLVPADTPGAELDARSAMVASGPSAALTVRAVAHGPLRASRGARKVEGAALTSGGRRDCERRTKMNPPPSDYARIEAMLLKLEGWSTKVENPDHALRVFDLYRKFMETRARFIREPGAVDSDMTDEDLERMLIEAVIRTPDMRARVLAAIKKDPVTNV